MPVLVLYAPNPKDGTASFDKVRFYEATDSGGTGQTLLSTVSVNLATRDMEDPGFTSYTHGSGSTAKYYASSYYNSTSASESSLGTYTKGGRDRLHSKFLTIVGDTGESYFDEDTVTQFEEDAIEAMFPELQREAVDVSLSISKSTTSEDQTYTIPPGFTSIHEVAVGDVDWTPTSDAFKLVKPSNWSLDSRTLHLYSLDGLQDTEVIRLIGLKKYDFIGEVPEKYDPLLLLHMQMSMYDWMASRFPRFEDFAQLRAGSGVDFDNLRVTAREFERRFKEEKLALARTPRGEEVF